MRGLDHLRDRANGDNDEHVPLIGHDQSFR